MKLLLRVVLSVAILAVISSSAFAQELLTNGGLEFPVGSFGGSYTTAPGWVTVEGPPVARFNDPQPGDYNDNGFVDAADYVVWRKNLGQNVVLPNESPTVTPGSVSSGDFNYWRQRFGNPGLLSMSEPSQFTHILDAFPPNPPAPDPDGEWQHWFQPYYGSFAEQEDNFAHLYQDVPATAGLQYTMSGWAMGEQVFPGGVTNLNATTGAPPVPTGAPFDDGPLSPTDVFFALEFLNASGTVLAGSVVKELKDDLGFVNSGDPDLVGYHWQQFTLNGTAPAGTVNVRVRVSMTDGVTNPTPAPQSFRMSFFVDEFSLTAAPGAGGGSGSTVPEPGTWILVSTALAAVGALPRRTRRTALGRS